MTLASATSACAADSANGRTGPLGRCAAAQLHLSVGVGFSAGNHFARTLVFTNVSRHACTLRGYPRLQLVGSERQLMHVPVRRGAGYLFTDHGPTLVRLASGAKASFAFGGTSVGQPAGALCPTVTRVLVTPPGDRTRISFATRAVACPTGISLTAVRAAPSPSAGHR